uniref:Glycerophosphocholine phosphodiesterase GPCPD1 n=2 Tax=Triatoma infestans TaxID=30076 RepID=A0A023FBW1_TRIIF
MMRWWNNEAYMKKKVEIPEVEEAEKISEDDKITRKWTFRVRADLFPGETLCVTGNCESLGEWKHDRMLVLTKEKDDGSENIWSGTTKIPLNQDVYYRYVVCIIVEPDGHKFTHRQFIERRWETNRKPRVIPKRALYCPKAVNEQEADVMGFYDNKERIDRGWLTTETAIQLKLFNEHLQIWKSKLRGRPISVKVTPVNLTRNSISQEVSQSADDCFSLETMDLTDKVEYWPLTEIAVLNQSERHFKFQEQFGRKFSKDDFIIFQILVSARENVALLIDFYSYPSNHREDEPPYHVGFSYILPSAMKNSEGQAVVPITSVRHRPIGELTVEYLVIKPTPNYTCDLSYSLHRQWKESWRGLDVGHRGVGTSFGGDIKQCAEVRENTIASLKSAASHGADFVEFDVQLSRDLVPVLYHDFYVAIAMMRKKQVSTEEMIQLPVKDLSLEQLQRLKLYHLGEMSKVRFTDDHLEEHQPFPTLKQALEILDPSVGFNIEIKWTMQLKDGTYELYHPFDLNLYLDTVLEVVLKHAGSRSIIFSCFHPDICTMIRLKQNRYPVMFLTQGMTDKYPPYHDPRCQSVPMAVDFAVCMDILGINVHTEDLLRDSSQVSLVKRAGLVLFCWGDDNNDTKTIKHLKELGIHAVIYDKIDQKIGKEVKESIFSLEARESERMLIRAAADRASTDEYLHPQPSGEISVTEQDGAPPVRVFPEIEMNDCLKETPLPSDMSLWATDAFGHDSSYDFTSDETS